MTCQAEVAVGVLVPQPVVREHLVEETVRYKYLPMPVQPRFPAVIISYENLWQRLSKPKLGNASIPIEV